jgi:hypothetical protein
MAIVPLETSVCMHTQKNVAWSVLITRGVSVNLVSSFVHVLCIVFRSYVYTLGPTCPRKHVRRVVCQLYLTGFCPMGLECSRGQ